MSFTTIKESILSAHSILWGQGEGDCILRESPGKAGARDLNYPLETSARRCMITEVIFIADEYVCAPVDAWAHTLSACAHVPGRG